jgi:hypothetical protein
MCSNCLVGFVVNCRSRQPFRRKVGKRREKEEGAGTAATTTMAAAASDDES